MKLKHRITATIRDAPTIYKFYDGLNGWVGVYFVDVGETRHMMYVDRCKYQ